MATVRAGPGRFDQSWIPPGQTTPSEGIYGTTKLEPWLHEYAYIYSSPRLDFTDEVYHTHLPKCHLESSHRHGSDQRHALGQHDKPDTRPERLDGTTTMNEASNIGVRSEGSPYYNTAIEEGIPRQSAPHSPSDLPPETIIGPQRPPEPPPPPPRSPESPPKPPEPPPRSPEPPPRSPEPPPRSPEPPPRSPESPPRSPESPPKPPEPPPRSPEPPPRSPESPPRPPESPPKRQHSSSSELGSNSTIPGSSYANSRVQDDRKPKRKKRFMGYIRGKRKDERYNGMNEPSDLANDRPHGWGDSCGTSTLPRELGQQYDAHYRHDSKEMLRPSKSVPHQSISSLFSKVKTSLARSRGGNQTSDENGRNSNAGRDSRSTTRSLSKLKQRVAKLTRHESKDGHRQFLNSPPLSSSHTTDVPTQHCPASSSSTLEHITPSSTSTICSPTAYEKHSNFGLNIQVIPQGPPRPFQCAFCLEQCENRSDWMKHERSHFPKQGWTCMINSQDRIQYDGRILCDFCGIVDKSHCFSQHNIDACVNSRLENRTFATEGDMARHLATVHNHDSTMIEDMQSWEWPRCMDSWFWSCGFCDSVLLSWDERQSHIADEHFENMCTMALWNPLTSPYPWSKQSSTLVCGFPRWEQSTLLAAIRQPTILDFINRVGETRPRNQCRLCKIAFSTFDDLSQHMTQWHGHPRSWSCPTPAKGSTFKDFFEPDGSYTDNSAVAENDICLYCGKKFSNNPPNWSLRKRHLEEEHHFNECAHEKFFKQDQFCRHLANSHNVDIEYMKDFISSCWREDDRTPATGLVVDDSHRGIIKLEMLGKPREGLHHYIQIHQRATDHQR